LKCATEIENDNLAAEALKFVKRVSSTPIPGYFNYDLQPKREVEGATQLIHAPTLLEYGSNKRKIQEKAPKTSDCKSFCPNEVPVWWKNLWSTMSTGNRFYVWRRYNTPSTLRHGYYTSVL
jgi:hypothetical protein